MITPAFVLKQNDTQLFITIKAPYTNVKETEIHVLEEDFRFYSAPYYLRLRLPGHVVDNENGSAKYISDTNSFEIKLDKVNPGEFFENLEMITTLLPPTGQKRNNPSLIEVLSSSGESIPQETINGDEWFIEQTMGKVTAADELRSQFKYGFANNHSGLGSLYEDQLSSVAEIKDPDSRSPAERLVQRTATEVGKFSEQHYMADLAVLSTEIRSILAFEFIPKTKLSQKNRTTMKELHNKEFLLDKVWQKRVYLGLVDILFAYIYDLRITLGSHCVESPWNISRLSATLSWFEVFDTVNEVAFACLRRSLCYPLYRNWELSQQIFQDIIAVLNSGASAVLKCFLDIRTLFASRDPYYLLNQLYIDDYCVWIQSITQENLSSIVEALKTSLAGLRKDNMLLDLDELEAAATATAEEEMETEISTKVSEIKL